MEEVKKFPLWKQAVEDAGGEFTFGDTISLEWLQDNFDLHPPDRGTIGEFKDYQFAFLASLEAFKSAMLEQYAMLLVSSRGIGYLIIEPAEQTGYAWGVLRRRVQKELNRAQLSLTNIQIEMLSADGRRENSNRLASLSMLRGFNEKTLDGGGDEGNNLRADGKDTVSKHGSGHGDSGEAEKKKITE